MKIVKIVLIIAIFLIALVLGAQNQDVVTVNYLIAKGDLPLSWLLGGVFAAGFVISWIIFGSLYFKSKLSVRRLSKKLQKYELKSDENKK